jgi:hypothetical protein
MVISFVTMAAAPVILPSRPRVAIQVVVMEEEEDGEEKFWKERRGKALRMS